MTQTSYRYGIFYHTLTLTLTLALTLTLTLTLTTPSYRYGIFYHAGTCLQTAGQSVGARLMRRARPAASAEDGACDMAEAVDDINGKISNMG